MISCKSQSQNELLKELFNRSILTASANFLGVSPSTFRIWLKKFDFKPISIDGQILYDKDVLQKFMEDHKL